VARREPIVRDLLEQIQDPLVARVVRVRAEVVSGAGGAPQGRREAAEKVLGLQHRDLFPLFRQGEARGQSADAAAQYDRVPHP